MAAAAAVGAVAAAAGVDGSKQKCIYVLYIRRMVMSDEYQGKTFKSGNSVALRLPKGMGIP